MDNIEEMQQKVRQHIEMLATPVDFDRLCEDGILLKVSKRQFKVECRRVWQNREVGQQAPQKADA